jgi:hypothetical protein
MSLVRNLDISSWLFFPAANFPFRGLFKNCGRGFFFNFSCIIFVMTSVKKDEKNVKMDPTKENVKSKGILDSESV